MIFIHPGLSTFVKKDLIFFRNHLNVEAFYYAPEKRPGKFLMQNIFFLIFLLKKIWKTKVVYSWFAGYHSLLPSLLCKILNKKMIIVVGGNDAVSIPEIQYGIFYKKNLRRLSAVLSYRMADLILPVHKSLIYSKNTYVDEKGIKVGVKHFVRNIKTRFIELPTGYDGNAWKMKEGDIKKQKVITIAGINNMKTYKGKGIDLLLEVALRIPDARFTIVGVGENMWEYIEKRKPENVEIIGFVDNPQLVEYLNDSKVYCQFSLSEGLPNSLCEAMLCECVPVGSSVNGIPDGIGSSGFILHKRDVDLATNLVQKALASERSLGTQARDHILKNFSNKKRENSLKEILEL